jgi:hypothetical protein
MEKEEREIEEQIERRNYLSAVSIAQRLGKSHEAIRELREAALKQYIIEYRNVPGAVALVGQLQFPADEVDRLLEAILQEASRDQDKTPSWAKKRYDAKAMKYLDIEEWISRHRAALKRAASP